MATAPRRRRSKPAAARADGVPMAAPASGVKVRMYRQGHGDCFLLAMRRSDGKPFYMLIDCGLWSKSEIKPEVTIDRVIADISQATGGRIDVVLVTHEHMDHVNGFAKKDPETEEPYFDPIQIGDLWLAWTESPDDPDAIALRRRFDDTLLALVAADRRLADGNAADPDRRDFLRKLISFEVGDEDDSKGAVAGDELLRNLEDIRRTRPELSLREQTELAVAGKSNKLAIKSLRDKLGGRPPTYLDPGKGPLVLSDVPGVRVFPLGPPKDVDLLLSLDPISKKGEEFKFALDGATKSFLNAVTDADGIGLARCFPSRFGMTAEHLEPVNAISLVGRLRSAYASGTDPASYTPDVIRRFFLDHYGQGDSGNAWRRIDEEWLADSDALALRLNKEVNNTSAVVAIELEGTGKVLLFSGDAQRGNWISWSDLSWEIDRKTMTARDLLGRTVFYKVGHHGSHNATLNGLADGPTANLAWMGHGPFAKEFVAVIPANQQWAERVQRWPHPWKPIETALLEKARGRVFRSDRDTVARPDHVPPEEWAAFERVETDLYFEYTILDA